MTDMRTEEEQIEAIKNWWKENGKQTLVAVVLVAGGWFFYQNYETSQLATAEAASSIYQIVLTLNNSEDEADKGKRAQLLDQLKSEFSNTIYGQFAALFNAKDAVESGDLELAAQQLRLVIGNSNDDALTQLATVRLARVLLAQGQAEAALALVDVDMSGAFEAEFEESKGDILLSLGDKDAARDAYSKASVTAMRIGANNPILKMKLDDLAVTN